MHCSAHENNNRFLKFIGMNCFEWILDLSNISWTFRVTIKNSLLLTNSIEITLMGCSSFSLNCSEKAAFFNVCLDTSFNSNTMSSQVKKKKRKWENDRMKFYVAMTNKLIQRANLMNAVFLWFPIKAHVPMMILCILHIIIV